MLRRSLRAGRVFVLLWMLVPAAVSRAEETLFQESFADDPIAAGRWQMMNGEDVSRFAYDAAGQTLSAHYDTAMPTARLVRPLGVALTHDSTFRCRVLFTIKSENFYADPYGFAQIAFGFLNSATTGVDRAGNGTTNSYPFDLVSFDYFPNLSSWANQTMCTTVVASPPNPAPTANDFYGVVSFPWGAESDLGNEQDVPKDTPLIGEVVYDGFTHRATLRLVQDGVPLLINDTGGRDGDTGTITTSALGAEFTVDRFGLLLWDDTWAFGATSVRADVVYGSIEVKTAVTADFNDDGRVDGDDFEMFRACRSEPSVHFEDGCDRYDADGDLDVDQDDFAAFQRLLGSE